MLATAGAVGAAARAATRRAIAGVAGDLVPSARAMDNGRGVCAPARWVRTRAPVSSPTLATETSAPDASGAAYFAPASAYAARASHGSASGLGASVSFDQPPPLTATQLNAKRTPLGRNGAETLVPRFETHPSPLLDPSTYEIDCAAGGYDMRSEEQSQELAGRMIDTFERLGLVVLRNTGLGGDLQAMRRWGVVPMAEVMKYEGGANSREDLLNAPDGYNIFDTGAPRQAHLHYHHEMAYVKESTTALAFCAHQGTGGVGPSYLSDNVVATEAIMATDFGTKLADKGVCYIRCLTDRDAYAPGESQAGVYNHWQHSFGVETPEEAEAEAAKKGLQVEWGYFDNGYRYMKTKFYVSAFEYFPKLDRNLLYSSVADHAMWFDTWPGVMDLPMIRSFESASPRERPLDMTFGDDTPFSLEDLALYVDAYDRGGFAIPWLAGDVLVFCNFRYAHGRPSFDLGPGQERDLGVVLGGMFTRVGQLPGKF